MRVSQTDGLMDHVMSFARVLREQAPLAMGMAKHIINTCQSVDAETGRVLERLGQSILNHTADNKEGVEAFARNASPSFEASD